MHVSEDVLFEIHDWALGMSPVTSYSGVKASAPILQRDCPFMLSGRSPAPTQLNGPRQHHTAAFPWRAPKPAARQAKW